MNNRTGGPRSFNTVKRSNRDDRLRRRRQGRMTLLAMCAVLLLLALTGLIFLVCHIAVSIQNRPPKDNPDDLNDPASGIQYQWVSRQYNEIYVGDLVVVNLNHEYHFPSITLEKVTDHRETVDGKVSYIVRNINTPPTMQRVAAIALSQMLAQYYRLSGEQLTAYDAYRTLEQQQNKKTPAGKSEHHTGLLVAISDTERESKLDLAKHSWLLENCSRYGFIQRYPGSKSGITGVNYDYTEAFRYVGVPHATYISQNNLCLEEYVELLKNHHSSAHGTDGKHLAIDTNGDGRADYEVYYVPADDSNSGITSVPVPENYEYSISGDNIGGFIVTVDLNTPKNG